MGRMSRKKRGLDALENGVIAGRKFHLQTQRPRERGPEAKRRGRTATVVRRIWACSKSTSQEESDGSDAILVQKKTLVEPSPVEPRLRREMATKRRRRLCGMEGWAAMAEAATGVGGKQQRHRCCVRSRAIAAANDSAVISDKGEIGVGRRQ
ncbi:hypothetical protein BHE74_00009463 [Ensete ventricosum]|nr:hypothetical protein BHE74_00009463 [Ensete ventricosum]RZS17607.1 hypothetical protein BHM03_00049770 [Ensete ventricosum]